MDAITPPSTLNSQLSTNRRCFKVTLEYDGTDFSGFQYQVGQRSVQGEVEQAIEKLTGQAVRINGAGRTDAGVHALGQVIGFQVETRIPVEKMASALNSALPRDVTASTVDEVDETFHARFSAVSREYVYTVLNREQPSAVFGRYSAHVPQMLEIGAMRAAARKLVGTTDYRAWANDTREVKSAVRTVHRCGLRRVGPFILFRIEANGFLKGMVRNIVGTLVEVGSNKRDEAEIDAITKSCDRSKAGPSAPAKGLCFLRARY